MMSLPVNDSIKKLSKCLYVCCVASLASSKAVHVLTLLADYVIRADASSRFGNRHIHNETNIRLHVRQATQTQRSTASNIKPE